MTGFSPQAVGLAGLWAAAGLGAAMVVYAWIVERRNLIRRHRLNDCGFVLIFGSTLVMTVVRGGPQSPLDWFMAVVSPIILALALWRLFHTNAPE